MALYWPGFFPDSLLGVLNSNGLPPGEGHQPMADQTDGEFEGDPVRRYEAALDHVQGKLAREALLILIDDEKARRKGPCRAEDKARPR